jgi:hypothetical protein
MGNEGRDPLILKWTFRRSNWPAARPCFQRKGPSYQLDRRPSGSQSYYGHCNNDKQSVNATMRGKIQRAACKVVLFYTEKSTPALGTTQTPIQWVPRVLSQGVKGAGA